MPSRTAQFTKITDILNISPLPPKCLVAALHSAAQIRSAAFCGVSNKVLVNKDYLKLFCVLMHIHLIVASRSKHHDGPGVGADVAMWLSGSLIATAGGRHIQLRSLATSQVPQPAGYSGGGLLLHQY